MSLARTLAPVLAAAVALVLVGVAVLAVRLAQGPIPLPGLTDRIERALSALSPDLVAQVRQTELAWAGDLPELRVVDVKIARRGDAVIAELPSLAVRPSLRALARGQLAVRRLEISGVNLSFVRDAQGRLLLGAINGGSSAPAPLDVREFFTTESAGGSAARYLKRIVVRDSHVEVEDRLTARSLRLEKTGGELVRHGRQFDLDLAAELSMAAPGDGAVREASAHATVRAAVLPPADGGFPVVTATITAENGKLLPAGDPGPALPLRSLVAEAKLGPGAAALQLTRLSATVGSAVVEGSGNAAQSQTGWSVLVQGEVRSLAVAELRRFWPVGAAASAREWVVKNIPEGTVPKCRYSIRLSPHAEPASPEVDPVDVSFDYQGLLIRYFGELDPVREVRGSAHISSQGLEALVTGGELGDLHLEKGSVDIRFRTSPPRLTTSADLRGPTAALLDELGRPPLDVPARIGIAATSFEGTFDGHVDVDVPLHSGLEGKEVRWKGRGDLSEAKVAGVLGPIGIENGKLEVRVEGKQVEVEGDTAVTGLEGVNAPAHLKLRVDPDDSGNHVSVELAGADVNADGTATFASGTLRALSLARLRLGATDLSGEITERQDGGYHVSVSGEKVDLERWLSGDKSRKELADSIKASYDGSFDVKKVLLGNGVELQDVSGTADGVGKRIERLEATGSFPGSGPLEINLAPRPAGRRLRVRSQNAGRVLKALGVFADAEGGRLTFIARFADGPDKKPTEGVVSVRDFRVIRAPILARILSAGSLTGIGDLLQGGGIGFTRARVPFRWNEGRIDVTGASAVGAMGLTAEGTIDRVKRTIDLRGRVIPAYTLNSALGKIPYVGDFLVGGKGEGVFGIDYGVSGELDHPDVDVNALSALAPGALRKLFVDPFSQPAEPEEAEPAAAK